MLLKKNEYMDYVSLLESLFQRCFQREIGKGQLEWRYVENPIDLLLVCLKMDGERVVANYSASPCQLIVHGEEVMSAISMTTMTDPEYAGRGYFTSLAQKTYDFMVLERFDAIWGFPNYQSHRGFVSKLGWKDVYEIPTLKLKLARIRNPELHGKRDDNFLLAYPEVYSNSLIHVKKSQAFLQWRYLKNIQNTYINFVVENEGRATSFCVVKEFESELDLVDMRACCKEEGVELLNHVITFAKEKRKAVINTWMSVHHFMHEIYEKMGFTNDAPVTYFGMRVLSENSDLSSKLSKYHHWYLQMGDSDVY